MNYRNFKEASPTHLAASNKIALKSTQSLKNSTQNSNKLPPKFMAANNTEQQQLQIESQLTPLMQKSDKPNAELSGIKKTPRQKLAKKGHSQKRNLNEDLTIQGPARLFLKNEVNQAIKGLKNEQLNTIENEEPVASTEESRNGDPLSPQTNRVGTIRDVCITTKSNNTLNSLIFIKSQSSPSRSTRYSMKNNSTLFQLDKTAQEDNEYMLLVVPGNPKYENSPYESFQINRPLMSISPVTNSHIQIFDQNFRKKTARLEQRSDPLFPLSDSINEVGARLLHDNFNINSVQPMTLGKMTTLATALVEKQRLNIAKVKKEEKRQADLWVTPKKCSHALKTSMSCQVQTKAKQINKILVNQRSEDYQTFTNPSARRAQAQSASSDFVDIQIKKTMRRTFSNKLSSFAKIDSQKHLKELKNLKWEQAIKITRLKSQKTLKNVAITEPDNPDDSTIILKKRKTQESRLFKQISSNTRRPQTMLEQHETRNLLAPTTSVHENNETSKSSQDLSLQFLTPMDTSKSIERQYANVPHNLIAQLRFEAQDILKKRNKKCSRDKELKCLSEQKLLNRQKLFQSQHLMRQYKKWKREYLGNNREQKSSFTVTSGISCEDTPKRPLESNKRNLETGSALITKGSEDINMFSHDVIQNSADQSRPRSTLLICPNEQINTLSPTWQISKPHRFQIALTMTQSHREDPVEAASFDGGKDTVVCSQIQTCSSKDKNQHLDQEMVNHESPTNRIPLAKDDFQKNPYPTVKTKFGSQSRDQLLKINKDLSRLMKKFIS